MTHIEYKYNEAAPGETEFKFSAPLQIPSTEQKAFNG